MLKEIVLKNVLTLKLLTGNEPAFRNFLIEPLYFPPT